MAQEPQIRLLLRLRPVKHPTPQIPRLVTKALNLKPAMPQISPVRSKSFAQELPEGKSRQSFEEATRRLFRPPRGAWKRCLFHCLLRQNALASSLKPKVFRKALTIQPERSRVPELCGATRIGFKLGLTPTRSKLGAQAFRVRGAVSVSFVAAPADTEASGISRLHGIVFYNIHSFHSERWSL